MHHCVCAWNVRGAFLTVKKRKVTDRMLGVPVQIEVDESTLEDITLRQLESALESLKDSYKERKKGRGVFFFHADKQQDLTEIKRYIEAFELVMSYYKVPT